MLAMILVIGISQSGEADGTECANHGHGKRLLESKAGTIHLVFS
jgi:hypothetical protein